MSKKSITIILVIMLAIGIVSLYTTFAYDEEAATLDDSNADYNFIYALKESSNKYITVSAKEEKHIDISLQNTYSSTVKYGMYYYMINPENLPNNVTIALSEDSLDLLENTIKPNQIRTISLIIVNNSDYNVDLIIGALVGFENGNIEELLKDGEVLIK